MSWQIVERRIGRAGGISQRTHRQRAWDQKYGEGNWEIGYVIDGEFVSQDSALVTIYQKSYEEHLAAHPEDLLELVRLAKWLRNPHAEATTGVDLQVPAIMACLQNRGLILQGNEIVDIGSWEGRASHPISVRLSPLQVKATGNPKMTLEKFWQTKKVLAVWTDD